MTLMENQPHPRKLILHGQTGDDPPGTRTARDYLASVKSRQNEKEGDSE